MKKRILAMVMALVMCLSLLPATALAAEEGTDSVEITLEKASVTLSGKLDIGFQIPLAVVDGCSKEYRNGLYAQVVRTYGDGKEPVTVTVPYADWSKDTIGGVTSYYVHYSDIAAKEMGDEIAVTIYDAAGSAVSNTYADSIKDEYGFNVMTLETSADIYQAVMTGTAAACMDDTPILKYSIKTGALDMKFVEGTENEPAQYGFAIFNADNQELVDLFNAGLENIRANGKYDEILANYLG